MASKKTLGKKTTKKSAPKTTLNKSQYIRANPDLPAKELVEKAKKAGLVLTENYIYTLRSDDRKKEGATPATKGKPARGASPKVASGDDKDVENQFARLIFQMGAKRARELFAAAEAKVENAMK